MALERFIPKSPDPFIRNSQDFEVAKFGHLNTIIEYINSYVVTDSLQLAGSGPITSTARYITDSLGNASAISISTTRVGIGTTAPTSELHIDGHSGFGASLKITTNKVGGVAYIQMISDYVTGFEQYQYGGPGWGWPNWTTTRAGGTAAAPTAVPSNYGLNEYSFWGHDGTGGGQAYSMMTRTSETWTTTGHGIYTVFNTVATGSTALVERMRFTGSGNITFNNASDTAKVAIKGSGSTSATTSFLVQNSAGTQLLRVKDNGETNIGTGATTTQIDASYLSLYVPYIIYQFSHTHIYGGTSVSTAMSWNFGDSVAGTARVQIKGTGTTSSTTSLLVQNSSASQLLKITDDGTVAVGGLGINSQVMFNRPSDGTNVGEIQGQSGGLLIRGGGQFINMPNSYQATIGTSQLSLGASWGIRGSGSTSATTSLLVQNSAGTTALQVKDDLTATFGGNISASNLTLSSGGAIYAGTQLRIGAGAITILSDSANSINFAAGTSGRSFGVSSAINGGPNSTAFLFIGDTATGVTMGSNSNSHASAVLDLVSTTKGFLPPRMTTTQKNAIPTPTAGLVVYDTDLNKLCVYTTAWQTITSV